MQIVRNAEMQLRRQQLSVWLQEAEAAAVEPDILAARWGTAGAGGLNPNLPPAEEALLSSGAALSDDIRDVAAAQRAAAAEATGGRPHARHAAARCFPLVCACSGRSASVARVSAHPRSAHGQSWRHGIRGDEVAAPRKQNMLPFKISRGVLILRIHRTHTHTTSSTQAAAAVLYRVQHRAQVAAADADIPHF